MPHASLLLMTSPILLGSTPVDPAAEGAQIEVLSTVLTSATIQTDPSYTSGLAYPLPHNILPLVWTLAAGQDNPPEPQSESGSEQGAQGEQSAQTDPEIVVEGEYGPPAGDPLGRLNESSYRVTQELDQVFVEPVAYAYRDALPDPLRDGLGNVVRNLREPANFLNFLLQLKVGDAFETLGRFAINSTIGVGGLFDVAGGDAIGLPYRRNGFANTLGYYGVGTGGYLYLPVAGATTLRDLIGDTLDQAVLPIGVGRPFNTPEYAIPYFVVSNLDSRLELDEELQRIGETVDPYAARRDTYLYRRARDIALLKGEEPPPPPTILREIEEGVDAIYEDEGIGDAPPIADEPQEAARLQEGTTQEADPQDLAAAVAITQPRTR